MATKQQPKKSGTKKRTPKKVTPELVEEQGDDGNVYYWIVAGSKKINAGRNERYARDMMEQEYPTA